MPRARDGAGASPIERSASGAAAAFDGNHTADPQAWLLANEDWDPELVPQMLDQLMDWVLLGHLAWVAFPPAGFRL